MPEIFTPPSLARRWGTAPETIISMIRRGELNAFTTSPPTATRPRWRISLAVVEAFERGEKPAIETPPAPRPRSTRQRRPGDVIQFFK
jgi:hypothetical protein